VRREEDGSYTGTLAFGMLAEEWSRKHEGHA